MIPDATIIEFIQSHAELKGYPPTIREIGDAVGLKSSSTVHARLAQLERKGLIQKGNPDSPRTVSVVSESQPLPTEVEEVFNDFFAAIVQPNGIWDLDQVKRELFGYHLLCSKQKIIR